MIYIAIDHINGEIQDYIQKYTINKRKIKKWLLQGYLVVEIDLIKNKIKEINMYEEIQI